MEQEKLKLKQTLSLEELVIYLEDLARSIRDGNVVVSQGDDFVSLAPGKTFNVEVEAKKKEKKGKIEIEIAWREEVSPEEELSISSSKPEQESEGPGPEKE